MGRTWRGTRGSIKGPPRLGFWAVKADSGGRRWHQQRQAPADVAARRGKAEEGGKAEGRRSGGESRQVGPSYQRPRASARSGGAGWG
jgi:hypothetical protein